MTAGAGAADGLHLPIARMEDLTAITALVDEACQRASAPEDAAFAVRLAVEEAFTNIVQHGYGDRPGPVRLGVRADSDRITVTLVDEARPFDPGDAPAPDLDSVLDDRAPGGLGWHLVRQLMDEVTREPGEQGGNVLALTKRLAGTDPRR